MARLYSALRTIAVVALVLAMAWALVEIFPLSWLVLEIYFPDETAEVSRIAVPLVGWITLRALEAVDVAAAVAASACLLIFRRGTVADISCWVLWIAGFVAVVLVLHGIAQTLGQALLDALPNIPWPDLFKELYGEGASLVKTWVSHNLLQVFRLGVQGYILALGLFRRVRNAINELRYSIYEALFGGSVDTLFPRQSKETAQNCANHRREAIEAFMSSGELPARHNEVKFTAGAVNRFVREYVERRQEVAEVSVARVPEFIELPRGSPIVARRGCLETPEEIAGQYTRLKLEARTPAAPLYHDAIPEETLLLLLARVVDAAILADRHFDGLREQSGNWNAMPSFDRIYVEYQKLPDLFECFFGAVFGNGLPARVVIETQYGDIFRNALFGGGKARRNAFGGWFGIGIKIEPPNQSQGLAARFWRWLGLRTDPTKIEYKPWFKADALCRRLKSRVKGVVSGKIEATFKLAPLLNGQTQPDLITNFHIMPSGPVADGCPSVGALPLLRGSVSNAPPMWWLLPKEGRPSDCRTLCIKVTPSDQEKITIDLGGIGTMQESASELATTYLVPGAENLRVERKMWVGAFFDCDLRLGNRFPLAACAPGGNEFSLSNERVDLRAAFAKIGKRKKKPTRHKEVEEPSLGGVFISLAGPERAANLLLPGQLLADFLNHLAHSQTLTELLPPCEGPEFVPSPEPQQAR